MGKFPLFFHSRAIVAILNKLAIAGTSNDGKFLRLMIVLMTFLVAINFPVGKVSIYGIFTAILCQNSLHNGNETASDHDRLLLNRN